MTNELNTILFLHILAAMLLVGGIAAHYVLHLRARGSNDLADLRGTMRDMRALEQRIIMPAGGFVGLLGLILAWRYDAKGVLSFADERWIHVAIGLWIVLNIIGGLEGRLLAQGYALGEDGMSADPAAIRARLNSGAYLALTTLNALIVLVILYLMVFKP